jgi:hypothetical protein
VGDRRPDQDHRRQRYQAGLQRQQERLAGVVGAQPGQQVAAQEDREQGDDEKGQAEPGGGNA